MSSVRQPRDPKKYEDAAAVRSFTLRTMYIEKDLDAEYRGPRKRNPRPGDENYVPPML